MVVRTLQYEVPEDAKLVGVVLIYTVPPRALHASFRAQVSDPQLVECIRQAALGALAPRN